MSDKASYRILIVDDEVHNIDMLCQILSPMYTLKTAKNGSSAIKMAEKHNPDLILLDIIMPDLSGFEVLAELKKSDLTKNIPVIFITGLDSIEDEEKGLQLGAVDYITKPLHNAIVKLRVSTHLKMIEQMRLIERLSMIDALTEIPNRRSFDNHMHTEWSRAIRFGTPVSAMMIDIDHFKDFNDNYGHSHGDLVLKTVAGIISHSLKRPSDFVARWGGEEFVVLLPNTELDGALEMAEQIRAHIECATIPFEGGIDTHVTISIGVSTQTPTVESVSNEIVIAADKALYAAKNAGRNRVIHSLSQK